MSRDHRKLRVFALADRLVSEIYQASQGFPASERFGLQIQLRRAAVSVVCNIVEGSARRTTSEYVNFLNIAAGSAAETHYLLELSGRLNLLTESSRAALTSGYSELHGRLNALILALNPKPRA